MAACLTECGELAEGHGVKESSDRAYGERVVRQQPLNHINIESGNARVKRWNRERKARKAPNRHLWKCIGRQRY